MGLAALHACVSLGTGYPGTPSTEILEAMAAYGGHAQWSPNEKVALEVGLGVAYGGARALVTMKHVGLNVAADVLFTAAYTGVTGGLVIVSADDPGMASSQNEQDNRHYAVAAGVPMLEPSDSQEAYDFMREAFELSEHWRLPVLFRVTTRVCHSKTPVTPRPPREGLPAPDFIRRIPERVMIPMYARPAHLRLQEKLDGLAEASEAFPLHRTIAGRDGGELGIVTSGVSFAHAREAAPNAAVLKLALTYPLPMGLIREFASTVKRCAVIEEGDPWLANALLAEGIHIEDKPERFRFGELNVNRVRAILGGEQDKGTDKPAPARAPGKAPALCDGCPYRTVFEAFREFDCIVAGDIGCYSLGVLPPFEAMDSLVCMGSSLGVGLGLRHVLPESQARRVVSVIGDSTFLHTGINGLIEMVYNPPPHGHVVVILDNATTAMTGHQEHPGTGRSLIHEPAGKVILEDLVRGAGVPNVEVIEPRAGSRTFHDRLAAALASERLTVLIARRPCLLIIKRLREFAAGAVSGEVCHAS